MWLLLSCLSVDVIVCSLNMWWLFLKRVHSCKMLFGGAVSRFPVVWTYPQSLIGRHAAPALAHFEMSQKIFPQLFCVFCVLCCKCRSSLSWIGLVSDVCHGCWMHVDGIVGMFSVQFNMIGDIYISGLINVIVTRLSRFHTYSISQLMLTPP